MDGALLGFGLAMDAFSVSVVNGQRNPAMKRKQMIGIAAVFGLFQAAMPLIGWVLVRTALDLFHPLKKIVPGAAFCILAVIGIKMLLEGIRGNEQEAAEETGTGGLMLQGLATSIDALSAGLTMAELSVAAAVPESLVVGLVTFVICLLGILIGRKAGTRFSGKSAVLGCLILIAIGIKTIVTGIA